MNIKLIATDVDGTLVADDHLTIPPINIKSLKMAKDRNINIVISTGRPYSLTDIETAKLGCVDYLVLSNGAVVVDAKTKSVIYDCYLPLETLEKIIPVFEKYPVVYEIYADCKGYINQYTYEHYFEIEALPQIFLKEYRNRMIICDNPYELMHTKPVEKLNVDYIPEEYIEAVMNELKDIPDLVFSAGFKGNMEIAAKGADKGSGLAWLADKLGIDSDEVMAFGDSGNDVTMLMFAGHSYAMNNGNEKAKNAARYVTKLSNSDGGVGDTIREVLINR